VLSERYGSRTPNVKELPSYDQVRADPTESAVEKLADIADIVIDTKRNSVSDVLARAATRLGLYGKSVERLVDVMIGGQYGSEGKGHVAAYLQR
jgi:adenylosuccinate synthase